MNTVIGTTRCAEHLSPRADDRSSAFRGAADNMLHRGVIRSDTNRQCKRHKPRLPAHHQASML